MPAPTRSLLDSTHYTDARLLGFDGPCDPAEDGEGLIITQEDHATVGPCITFQGPHGCIELTGEDQILQVLQTLTEVVNHNRRRAAA